MNKSVLENNTCFEDFWGNNPFVGLGIENMLAEVGDFIFIVLCHI